MKAKIFALIACANLIQGCSSTNTQPPLMSSPYILSKQQIEAVKSSVLSSLKDPDSAKFSSSFNSTRSANKTYVCGYVNARNSFGGYVGDKPFYTESSDEKGGFQPAAIGGKMFRSEDIGSSAIFKMCAQAGIGSF